MNNHHKILNTIAPIPCKNLTIISPIISNILSRYFVSIFSDIRFRLVAICDQILNYYRTKPFFMKNVISCILLLHLKRKGYTISLMAFSCVLDRCQARMQYVTMSLFNRDTNVWIVI